MLAWVALGFAVLAAGALGRTYVRPEGMDLASRLLTRGSTAMVLAGIVGQLPQLLKWEGDALRWAAIALAGLLLVFAFAQLRRVRRFKTTGSRSSV